MRRFFTLFAAVAFLQSVSQPSQADYSRCAGHRERRLPECSPVPNPPNDAADVAAALRRSGFDTILALDRRQSRDGRRSDQIRKGCQKRRCRDVLLCRTRSAIRRTQLLGAVDAKLTDQSDLRRLVRVDQIVADLQQAKTLRILVLNSCRDNPLADQLKRSIGTARALPLQVGLAKIDAPQGMIVAYAVQAGRKADDRDGRNSPYTSSFLRHIEEQEEIGTVFRRVSSDVLRKDEARAIT